MNRPPAFESSVIARFPVDEFRKDSDAGLEIETERGLILKADVNCGVVKRVGEFHAGNDLALCLGELENAAIRFLGSATLGVSHCASQWCFGQGCVWCLLTGAARS